MFTSLFAPLSRRIGTFVGATAGTMGYTGDIAQVEAAAVFLVGVAVDILLSNINRRLGGS